MRLSPGLLSLFAFLKLVIAVVGNNDSTFSFPPDDEYQGNSQLYGINYGVQQVFAPVRGTSIYEKYVDDIISKGITKLTLAINNLLNTQQGSNENILFSPLSITHAMALVLLGSNGLTFKEISDLWGLQTGIPDIDKKSQIVHEEFSRMINKLNQTQNQLEVHVASAVFVQEGYEIRPIYRSIAEDLYKSQILNVDFAVNPQAAQRIINDWVAAKTSHKIKTILNDVPNSDTKVILTSALYFKAEWEKHFFPESTRRRPFYVEGRHSNTNIEADMMANGGDFPYYKDAELGCEILGFPYKGNATTMYIIMPFGSSREKLLEFESKITGPDINNLISKTKVTGAVILFPRMKIESTIDLKETLKRLGVTSLFDPNNANLALLSPTSAYVHESARRFTNQTEFKSIAGKNLNTDVPVANKGPKMESRIGYSQSIDNIRQLINEQSTDNNYQNPGLYADQVIHKVFMDITETGTEAAAATGISLTKDGSKVTFRVDVPFCFFIRHDETNTILFWGSVVRPEPSYVFK